MLGQHQRWYQHIPRESNMSNQWQTMDGQPYELPKNNMELGKIYDNPAVRAFAPIDEEITEGGCWEGYKQVGMKEKNGKMVPNCVPINENIDELDEEEVCLECLVEYMIKAKLNETLDEAEYQGRKVPLGKPMRGDVKKFKVFVRDPKTGNVKKVNFGDKKMRIKKSNPKRRKSFRARHRCSNPGPRTKARYWSCRKW